MKLALDYMSELYYKAFKNAYTGYDGVTLRQLLDHLVTTYAAIDQFDLEKNQENTTARYDPNAPIEALFAQIADGVAYSKLGEAPFTSKQVVDIALVQRRPQGVESLPTPRPYLAQVQGAFFQSAPRVEGEPTPHRGAALSKDKCSRCHKCT